MERMMYGTLPRLRIYTSSGQYWDVARALISRQVECGGDVHRLERKIEQLFGVRHAIAMPMARVAIYATLRSLIRPGQEVILSPYTIADVVNMVICAGGVPVFADIERETCNIDPDEVARLINKDTGAVLVTHFYGLLADLDRLHEICDRHNVPLIEDAAQAFGGRLGAKLAGTIGKAGIFSFGVYKNVNSFLGGMIVTDDSALAERVRAEVQSWPYPPLRLYLEKVISGATIDIVTYPTIFRNFSFWLFRYAFLHDISAINNRLKIDFDPKIKRVVPPEYLWRMLPLQARMILKQLDRVDNDMRVRIAAAKMYDEGLRDCDELILPPLREDGTHIYWYYPIQFQERHSLVQHAMRKHRDITESYHRNCAALPCFAQYRRECPNAEATASSLIYLPTYPRYSQGEIRRTIAAIRQFFGR
jgi:perosamine synthetase